MKNQHKHWTRALIIHSRSGYNALISNQKTDKKTNTTRINSEKDETATTKMVTAAAATKPL